MSLESENQEMTEYIKNLEDIIKHANKKILNFTTKYKDDMKLKEDIFESEMHSLKNDYHMQLDMVMNENEDKISSLSNDVEKYKNESNDYNLTIKKQINEINDLENQLQIFKNRGISLENEFNYNMCNSICFEII